MKKTLFLLLLTFVSQLMFAQHRFVIQNGSAAVYGNINDAINNASAGDTLYLPGGTFSIDGGVVDKPLVWIGAGYFTDSTLATAPTIISNSFQLNGNADGTYITGVLFDSYFTAGQAGDDVTDLTVERCLFSSSVTLRSTSSNDTVDTNFKMRECVILGIINGKYTKNASFENTMMFNRVEYFIFSDFTFCNFNARDYNYSRIFRYLDECFFENCIIPNDHANSLAYLTNCTFNNCMWNFNKVFPEGTNTGTANIVNVDQSLIYTDYSTGIQAYSEDNDYHLVSGSPGENAATDGTDVGIYGGTNPFKEGGVPFNPHIRSVIMPTQTTDGNLPVQISVGSQTN